jgi:hypothetical protein
MELLERDRQVAHRNSGGRRDFGGGLGEVSSRGPVIS